MAAAASKFVLVADHRKDSQVLGQSWTKGVPLEVLPGAYVTVMKRIEALGGKPHLRMAVNKAGPVITDNGAWSHTPHSAHLTPHLLPCPTQGTSSLTRTSGR